VTLRHLLMHIDSSERSAARLDLPVGLARRFDAALTGLFAENDPHVMTVAALDPAGALAPDAAAAAALFRERVDARPIRSDWQTVMTASDDALIRQTLRIARNADLAILGQHDPERTDVRVPADLAEQVILQSGRPVLVVPYAGHFVDVGRRVLIAWNGSREASRALNDAMPILRSAEYVVLLAINPDPEQRPGENRFAPVSRHLQAHGIDAQIETLRVEDIDAMDMLLSRLTDEGIDLLVMGAYGQYAGPLSHRGASTRHILGHMTVPVLMSHWSINTPTRSGRRDASPRGSARP
jgi:nucleotide-binding universal stress UspA family protein